MNVTRIGHTEILRFLRTKLDEIDNSSRGIFSKVFYVMFFIL